MLSQRLHFDLTSYPFDGPVPEVPHTERGHPSTGRCWTGLTAST